MALLEIDRLEVAYAGRSAEAPVRAVAGVSLAVPAGASVGLVGESGCGKSSVANAVVGLADATGGRIVFDGRDVTHRTGRRGNGFARRVQMVFQDPFGSLNPRLTIGEMLGEVLAVHRLGGTRRERQARIVALLEDVGLPLEAAGRYPHEFSGGQRQRLGLARALAVEPDLIIADEPVSALDVSVQVQVLDLMRRLQRERELAYLFIAHDLAVVRHMCQRVNVMYLGRIVEAGETARIFARPAHPYTEALLSAAPDVDRGLRARTQGSRRIVLRGDVPSPAEHPSGCPFHTRCHRVQPLCRTRPPAVRTLDGGRWSACHFADALVRG